jgi:microcompartment protein CcmL/EutN
MEHTLALLEIEGGIATVEAVDSIVKSAPIQFLGHKHVGNGTLLVFTGDRKTVLAAVEVGIRKAQLYGTVIASRVIALPHNQTSRFVEQLLNEN